MLPTVAEILDMPVVRAGEPRVIGGAQGLDRPVRWVHVSETADLATLVSGGELILTTGQPLAYGAPATGAYLESLAAAAVAGLVVELGRYVTELPTFVATVADRLGLPVVALRRITRFVEVTEAVHRMIVADQYAELEFAHSVHETFSTLSVRRASLEEIVKTAATLLDSSVVLEDLAHRVLAVSARGTSAAALLENWETTSRMLPDDVDSAVPVGPHTQRWGRLLLRSESIPSARARMVLERAAQTLTLHRMIEKDRFGLHRQAQTGLIEDMVAGRVIDEQEAVARAATLGLARRARYVPVTVRVAAVSEPDPLARQRRAATLLDAAGHGVALSRATALSAADEQQLTLILGIGRDGELDPRLEQVCAALAAELRRTDGVQRIAVGVGADSESLLDAARELAHAAHVAEIALALESTAPRSFYRSGDVRLRGLLSLIRNEPGVQRFAETELSALLRHDIRHRGDLTPTLRRFLDLAGNKTELARRMNISRPALYDRLARIERILGVDLNDGEIRTSLHTALLIRDLTAGFRE
ncbi:PucR family transcriptional regulator [Nocardia jiangxiensis]|uniref:PucR family transcriptional regulator n=1 Tax=Nocardia jiangxiensis TaxID=282685 RepID=A0ABW6RUQ4_9NOCA|nr:PucR family transcriptional regulator [Nocardia jiangxiensis]